MIKKNKLIIYIIAVSFISYIWLIEPQWIEINQYNIIAPIDKKISIMQISDFHIRGFGAIEKKVIDYINTLKPDVIVLTGDVSSPNTTPEEYELVFSKIKAPQGVFIVNGNWEYWVNHSNLKNLLEKNLITNLDNTNKQLGPSLYLIGFDDALEGIPDEKKAFLNVPENSYRIGLFHSPVFFDSIFKKLNLSLSGHTHGGQIRVPFLPLLWLPPGSGNYSEGWYKKDQSSMYVSRGIGTSVLPFRLFCRPEIAVFHLSRE